MDFFYDNQIRRYILQFQRIFSNIKTERSDGRGGSIQSTVPVVRGDMSRSVASILQGGTQNATVPIPCFSVSIDRLDLAADRRASPAHESSVHMTERRFDGAQYTNEAGNKVTVDRYMAVPYDLYINLGILTSNIDTKLQLVEQIMTIFNPALQLTQTDNYLDWTSVFEVELMGINWSEDFGEGRTISTLSFKIPIWISPPSKIKRQSLIEQIVTNIGTDHSNSKPDVSTRCIVTPGDCSVNVEQLSEGMLQLSLSSNHGSFSGDWDDLLDLYGVVEYDTTKILLNGNSDIEDFDNVIIGYISEVNGSSLNLSIDTTTLPVPNLPPVLDLLWSSEDIPPTPTVGDRYILVDSSSSDMVGISDGDIIVYTGSNWDISSPNPDDTVYIDSQHTMLSFAGSWSYTYLGNYAAGYWRILDMIEKVTAEEYVNGDC